MVTATPEQREDVAPWRRLERLDMLVGVQRDKPGHAGCNARIQAMLSRRCTLEPVAQEMGWPRQGCVTLEELPDRKVDDLGRVLARRITAIGGHLRRAGERRAVCLADARHARVRTSACSVGRELPWVLIVAVQVCEKVWNSSVRDWASRSDGEWLQPTRTVSRVCARLASRDSPDSSPQLTMLRRRFFDDAGRRASRKSRSDNSST